MAEFWTITQKGYTFNWHNADKLIADEEWSIERVASFIAIHHVLNIMATRYSKGLTMRPKVAAIQYTLKCDPESSKDINKLTKYLVPQLCSLYNNVETQSYLGRPLNLVLDDVTVMAQEYVSKQEAPIEVFGKMVKPDRFYSRPTQQEYDAILEKEQRQEQRYWEKFKEVLDSGSVHGHRILVRDGNDTYTAYLKSVTKLCVYVDLKDEYGRLVQTNARMPRNSPRFIIESFC